MLLLFAKAVQSYDFLLNMKTKMGSFLLLDIFFRVF